MRPYKCIVSNLKSNYRKMIFIKMTCISIYRKICFLISQNIQTHCCQTLSIQSFFVFIADNFDLGYDIQQYFALHQNLFLEDLARTNSRHTLNGLMRVVSKVRSFFVRWLMLLRTSIIFKASLKSYLWNTFPWFSSKQKLFLFCKSDASYLILNLLLLKESTFLFCLLLMLLSLM